MLLPSFVGGLGEDVSLNYDSERTLNLFVHGGSGKPKTGAMLIKAPGLNWFLALPGGPCRGLFAEDGRAFAVIGTYFYELFTNQTAQIRGFVQADSRSARFASNGDAGHQIIISSGGKGYIFDLLTNVLSPIVASGFPVPCAAVDFVDGYFVALQEGTNKFYLSALEDGMLWDPTDVGQVSETSNRLVTLIVSNRLIWLLGTLTTEIWYNSGNADFPFTPVQGALIQHGIQAGDSIQQFDNTVAWIMSDKDGFGIVVKANGYTPVRISTPSVEKKLAATPNLDQAVAWTYQQDGHAFFVISAATAETDLVFDATTNIWHERARWNATRGMWEPSRQIYHCSAFGRHLVGDRLSGFIYTLSRDYPINTIPVI